MSPSNINRMTEPIDNKQVNNPGAAPASAPENVSPQGVNPEAPKEPVVVDKKEEQINNLNRALQEEREIRKQESEARKKIEEEFNKAKPIIDRFQNFIAPEKPIDEQKPQYLTKEEADALWQQKLDEQKQQVFKEKQAEIIKAEIANLEKEFDGSNGKPKYIDEEVLKWQQANQKLYLTPVEAFNLMKKNEIRDWEVKQVLSGKKKVENVAQPGVSPDIHIPAEFKPKSDKELQDAIREAVNSADVEM